MLVDFNSEEYTNEFHNTEVFTVIISLVLSNYKDIIQSDNKNSDFDIYVFNHGFFNYY